jgi:hypothetical protein
VQLPEIQDQPWCNAEIDEIGETVEFGAEFRLALIMRGDAAMSMPSSTAANTIAATANSIRPSVERRSRLARATPAA